MFDEVSVSRFWNKVDKSAGPDACWPWTGAKRGGGYGVCTFQGRQVGAHRVSLLLKTERQDLFDIKGVIYRVPSLARHLCDNKICVNPAHLEWGTPEQNCQDRSPESYAASCAKMIETKTRTGVWGGRARLDGSPQSEPDLAKMARWKGVLEAIAAMDWFKVPSEMAQEALNPTTLPYKSQ